MDPILARCAGLDVHQKSVVACVRKTEAGGRISEEVRTFGTATRNLLDLSDWLASHRVEHVAMESTGVYWKPVWNLLEDRFPLLLVNPRHIKKVPGRKTDVSDSQWLAHLLQVGLLSASFVPPRAQRDLRDLTRHRSQLVAEHTRALNRIQKVLEDANIKLSSVVSDIDGVSSRDMISALANGQDDPMALADLARRRLRKKIPELQEALLGNVRQHHRFLLKTLCDHARYLEQTIESLEREIDRRIDQFPTEKDPEDEEPPLTFREAVDLAITIPGIQSRSAQCILSEIGIDMRRFPDARHLCSWAKVCSGNNESAGKRRSTRTGKGNRWLRTTLVQVGWAAGRTKNTYLAAQYHRLAARIGKKRATVAVAHTILTALYHMLSRRIPYTDLGPDYLDRLHQTRIRTRLVKRLENLGYHVQLTQEEDAA